MSSQHALDHRWPQWLWGWETLLEGEPRLIFPWCWNGRQCGKPARLRHPNRDGTGDYRGRGSFAFTGIETTMEDVPLAGWTEPVWFLRLAYDIDR